MSSNDEPKVEPNKKSFLERNIKIDKKAISETFVLTSFMKYMVTEGIPQFLLCIGMIGIMVMFAAYSVIMLSVNQLMYGLICLTATASFGALAGIYLLSVYISYMFANMAMHGERKNTPSEEFIEEVVNGIRKGGNKDEAVGKEQAK